MNCLVQSLRFLRNENKTTPKFPELYSVSILWGLSEVAPGLLAAPLSRQETTILGHQKGRTGSLKSWMVFGSSKVFYRLPWRQMKDVLEFLGIIVQLEHSVDFCSCYLHAMVVPNGREKTPEVSLFQND